MGSIEVPVAGGIQAEPNCLLCGIAGEDLGPSVKCRPGVFFMVSFDPQSLNVLLLILQGHLVHAAGIAPSTDLSGLTDPGG